MTQRPRQNRWLVIGRLTIVLTVGLSGGLLDPGHGTAAVAAVNPPAPSPGPAKNNNDEAPRVLLLGATIFGTVAAPNVPYELPWQEPFLLGRGASELERNFLKEIFRPIDREEFLKSSPSPEPSGK